MPCRSFRASRRASTCRATATRSSTRPTRTIPGSTARCSSRRIRTWAGRARSTTPTLAPRARGRTSRPAFDLANYTEPTFASFPTANVQIADGIRSPLTREFTLGLGRELGDRGHAKATYAWRSASQFVEDFLDLSHGVTNVPLVGDLTNRVYDNTDALYRDYQALIVQSAYRLFARVKVDGHYTLQLRNNGTFSGEASNQPGIPSIYGNFPEIFGPALDRLAPEGRLDNYQQHKLRVTTTYQQSLGRFGSVDIAPLWRVNSGGVYSLTSLIRVPAAQLARNPGYPATDVSAATRETVLLRRPRRLRLQGLRRHGPRDVVQPRGVEVGTAVGEARGLQPVQQPEADRVGQDRLGGSGERR